MEKRYSLRCKRRRSIGELISSLVFFFVGIFLILEGRNIFLSEEIIKGSIVIIGGLLSFVATFRFQIKQMYEEKDE